MSDSALLQSVNPATGQLLQTYQPHTGEEVGAKLSATAAAAKLWRRESLADRAATLRKVAVALRENADALAKLAALEMGKPIEQGKTEIGKCAAAFDFYADHGAAMLADIAVATDASKSYIHFEPLGVVLAVMPWNFPFWQVFRAMAPIMMAGNGFVLKHASNVSGCALAIEELVKTTLPPDLFSLLLVPSSEVEGIIKHPAIAAVTFTGSTGAGKAIASAAGSVVKKAVLELGGSDAYIILADADLDLAARTCVDGRLVNTGQSCVAAKRFIVVKEVRADFETRVLDLMKAATWGDPMDSSHKIGPLARTDLRDALHKQVLDSVAAGATLLCGGFIPEGTGAYYPPTLLTDVREGMPAYQEELFGPVATLIEAADEADAVRFANDSEYGLGAGIFSKDVARAEVIAATQLEAGSCFVNAFVHSDPRLPFGGVKSSGYGRELSEFGIREFVNIKTVFVQ